MFRTDLPVLGFRVHDLQNHLQPKHRGVSPQGKIPKHDSGTRILDGLVVRVLATTPHLPHNSDLPLLLGL